MQAKKEAEQKRLEEIEALRIEQEAAKVLLLLKEREEAA